MPEFLSAAWVRALDAAARAADDLTTAAPFVVETLVVAAGSDDGDGGYQVRFGSEGVTVASLGTHVADVVLVTDAETAWAIHRGTTRAQDALAEGRLKVRGRPEVLSGHADVLAALTRVLAPLRDTTTPRATPSRAPGEAGETGEVAHDDR